MPSRRTTTKKLTPKQELFVHEYLKDQNGAQAAIRAGYSPKTAKVTAFQLLKHPHISLLLQRQQIEHES